MLVRAAHPVCGTQAGGETQRSAGDPVHRHPGRAHPVRGTQWHLVREHPGAWQLQWRRRCVAPSVRRLCVRHLCDGNPAASCARQAAPRREAQCVRSVWWHPGAVATQVVVALPGGERRPRCVAPACGNLVRVATPVQVWHRAWQPRRAATQRAGVTQVRPRQGTRRGGTCVAPSVRGAVCGVMRGVATQAVSGNIQQSKRACTQVCATQCAWRVPVRVRSAWRRVCGDCVRRGGRRVAQCWRAAARRGAGGVSPRRAADPVAARGGNPARARIRRWRNPGVRGDSRCVCARVCSTQCACAPSAAPGVQRHPGGSSVAPRQAATHAQVRGGRGAVKRGRLLQECVAALRAAATWAGVRRCGRRLWRRPVAAETSCV
ncbi:hypothetical protein GPJ56_004551 [Histomonas meleagridis]|nr:hypothetical protein GPJ56_004551 [Histomonas meleagridis]